MKILVLNCGSSSIKYKLFDMDSKEVIAQGGIEKIGLKGSFLKFTLTEKRKYWKRTFLNILSEWNLSFIH